jgi:hypothetical protein
MQKVQQQTNRSSSSNSSNTSVYSIQHATAPSKDHYCAGALLPLCHTCFCTNGPSRTPAAYGLQQPTRHRRQHSIAKWSDLPKSPAHGTSITQLSTWGACCHSTTTQVRN